MMKEVLQSNKQLRETNQSQSDEIDNLNSLLFQCQNENEDLIERLQTIEDFTDKDLMEEVLENRVRQLEQSSMNMVQFQSIRQQFHQQKVKLNQSLMGMEPKATLEDQFNDDYEDLRCQWLSELAAHDPPPSQMSIQYVKNTISSQKQPQKKKGVLILGKQQRGKSTNAISQGGYDSRNTNVYSDTSSQNERHQEYKIRAVRNLAQAYHQSNSFGPGQYQQMVPQSYQGKNMLKTTQFQNRPTQQAFMHPQQQSRFGQAPMNMTAYTQSPFNAQQYGPDFYGQEDEFAMQMRSKSPMLQTQNVTQSRVTPNQSQNTFPRQNIQTADAHFGHQMSDLSTSSAQGQMPQPHITMRKKDQMIQGQKKPPKTPNKQGGQPYPHDFRSTNQSFKTHNAGNLTQDNINTDPFFAETPDNGDEDVQDIVYQQSEEDDFMYGDQQDADAYEVMNQEKLRHMQQMQNMHLQQQQQQMMMQVNGGGLQLLDVSLPKIRNN